MENKTYTAGEIAALSGVSARTIRFYDKKGLLKPVSYTESGYRLYDRDSFSRLQRILMFKYLGFSLEQIRDMLTRPTAFASGEPRSSNPPAIFEAQLREQKELLEQKRKKLDRLLETVEFALECKEGESWNSLLRLLSLLSEEEKIAEQYRTDENLNRRIRIHSYNTNPTPWMEWVYDRLPLKAGSRVLELGCGNALLWESNMERLPEGLSLLLADYSEGMLTQAKQVFARHEQTLLRKQITVRFEVADANHLALSDADFDVVIANHMLYHVENRASCLKKIHSLLKPGGALCCTTVGENHMQELHGLVQTFDPALEIPLSSITRRFSLQNAQPQLEKVFRQVVREDFPCDLRVTDPNAVYDYIYSYPGNAPLILERKGEQLRRLIESQMEKDGTGGFPISFTAPSSVSAHRTPPR